MSLTSLSSDAGSLVISWSFAVPAHAVWAGFTEQTLLSRWLGQPVEHDVRIGGMLVVDHGGGHLSRSNVTAADPPLRLEMSWEMPDEPVTRIGIRLQPSDAGTTMTLVHDDLGGLGDSYGPGWITHLTYLEAVVGGTSIPQEEFWRLHATFERLYTGLDPA